MQPTRPARRGIVRCAAPPPMSRETCKALLRPVSPDEAARISPWPDRIAGKATWHSRRRGGEARREYEEGWYAGVLERWRAFSQILPSRERHPGVALRFLDEL